MLTTKWILKRLNYSGDVILVGQEEYSMGRGKDNYLSVLSIYVSRKHCIFRVTGHGLVVKDLGSSNGTFVNESRIPANQDVLLRVNDRIGIGVAIAVGSDHYVYTLLIEADSCNNIAIDGVKSLKSALPEGQKESLNINALDSKEEDEENDILFIENKKVDIIELSDDDVDDDVEEKRRVSVVGSSSSASTSKHSSRNTSSVLEDLNATFLTAVQNRRETNPCSIDKCNSNFNSTNASDSVLKRTNEQTNFSHKTINIIQQREGQIYPSNQADTIVASFKVKEEPDEQYSSHSEKSYCERRGLNVSSKTFQSVVKTEKLSSNEISRRFGDTLQTNSTFNNGSSLRVSPNVSKSSDSNSCRESSLTNPSTCSSTGLPFNLETTSSLIGDAGIHIKEEKSNFDFESATSNKSSESTLFRNAKKRDSKVNTIPTVNELLNKDVRNDYHNKVKIEKPSPEVKVNLHKSSNPCNEGSNSTIPTKITIKKEKDVDDICAESVKKNSLENTEVIVGKRDEKQPNYVSPLLTSTIERSFEAQLIRKSKSTKQIHNVSESEKHKNNTIVEREKTDVPVLSEKTEKHKKSLKRSHEISNLQLPGANLNDSADTTSKKMKFGPVTSRNVTNNSNRSSSSSVADAKSSNFSASESSEDVDVDNPDKWFAKLSVHFLEQLEKTVSAKNEGSGPSCSSKTKRSENCVANNPELETEITKSKLDSNQAYCIKDFDPLPGYLNPVVIVKHLNLKNCNENFIKICDETSSCETLFEEDMQVLKSEQNLEDTSVSNSLNQCSQSLNYSQIDDVIVIDDDDDDYNDIKDNVKSETCQNSHNDGFKDNEEVVVKQEIFDDDYEVQIDNDNSDDDDDEVQLVNDWVCKLSQSSQLLDDDIPLSVEEENKRLSPANSKTSDEEIALPAEQRVPSTVEKFNEEALTSDDSDNEIFKLGGTMSKNNERASVKPFASIDKDGLVLENKKTDKYKSLFSLDSNRNDVDDAILKTPQNSEVDSDSDEDIIISKGKKSKNLVSEKNIMRYDPDEWKMRNKIKRYTNNFFKDKNEKEFIAHSNFSTNISDEDIQDINRHSAYNNDKIYSKNQKSSLSQKRDVQKSTGKDILQPEMSLEERAEKLFDSPFRTEKDKKDDKSDEKIKSSDNYAKARSNNTKEHSTSSTQSSNRRTLICSALPIASRSRRKANNEKPDKPKTLDSDSVKAKSSKREKGCKTTIDVKPGYHENKLKSPDMKINDNHLTEKEKLDKVREERKAKLKALTAQKAEAARSIREAKINAKSSYRAKNTALSRADKLAESFVSSNKSSGEKREKIKVRVVVKKHDIDKSSANDSPHSFNSAPSITDSIEKDPSTTITDVIHKETSCDALPEIEKQIKNLSFKNDYRIPKRKSATSLPVENHTSTSKSVKEKIIQKTSKVPPKPIPLRSAIKTVTSYPKKSVHFAPTKSLCTVQSFHIEDGNSLHRIEGKDAPVRKTLASQAETLYDSSQNILNSVISAILKSWHPRWFQEEKIVAQNGGEPPPAHCESTPVSSICPMLTTFTSYEEYLRIVRPLMLLDLWARVSEDANKPNQRAKEKYEILVQEKRDVNGLLILSCSMPISAKQDRERLYPHVGDLCTIRCPIWDSVEGNVNNTQGPHQEKYLERFAYIESMTRDYRSVHDSTWRQGNWKNITGPVHCILHFVIKLKGDNRLNLVKLTIKVISCIRSELRMFEAVGYLEHTRLCKMILNPCISDYKLPRINSRMQLKSRDILNEAQNTAVLQCSSICLRSAPKLCLIQGPPGTGKTKVIVNIIQQILYPDGQYSKQRLDKKTRILLCAPSNAAADEMAERLLAIRAEMKKENRFKMVRIGPLESIRESIRGVSLDELTKKEVEASVAHQMSLESVEVEIATLEARKRSYVMACEHASSKKENTAMYEKRIQEVERRLTQLRSPMRNVPTHKTFEMEREARKKLLSFADIIVSTLSSSFNPQMTEVFASRNGRSLARFTCCIIDEATQSKEPECLIPLMYGIEKIVMVGDPEQLPATVLSQIAKEKSFGQSLFNRIWNKFQNEANSPVIFLNTQYRMHPDIYLWPNTYIYHGKVKSDYGARFILKPYCLFAHQFPQHSFCFLNSNEAVLVSDIAMLVAHNFSSFVKTIGVITPYQKQLQEIKNHIDQSRPHPVTILVNTIDGFQGRECDVIIFSCVRTRGIGFMCESQRLNVALTRARHSLIICGNFVSLRGDKMWASLLGDALQRRVVIDTNDCNFSRNNIVQHLTKF